MICPQFLGQITWENPFIESFNGTFRSECLDRWVFADGREAQAIIEQWRQEYNHRRPHSSLGYLPRLCLRTRLDSHSKRSSLWGRSVKTYTENNVVVGHGFLRILFFYDITRGPIIYPSVPSPNTLFIIRDLRYNIRTLGQPRSCAYITEI